MAHPKAPAFPPAERINVSYKQLAAISPELHAAAKELSKTIKALNEALAALELGVPAWSTIASGEDDNGYFWSRSIGYTFLGYGEGGWGIALREASGNLGTDDHTEEVWPFSKAPRWMAIESVAKLPELFEALIERVQDTTTKLKARTEQTKELLDAVQAAAGEISTAKAKK